MFLAEAVAYNYLYGDVKSATVKCVNLLLVEKVAFKNELSFIAA